jgi:hypothetical protein
MISFFYLPLRLCVEDPSKDFLMDGKDWCNIKSTSAKFEDRLTDTRKGGRGWTKKIA